MTGEDFEEHIQKQGLLKKDAARILGVSVDTITARCQDKSVPPLYRYAIFGLVLERNIDTLIKMRQELLKNCS